MDELLKFTLLAIFAGAGGFLGSYLKRKGENLATHEDINRLVDQVRAVTKATKEIEAKISDDVWDRQKRWELKREALFESIRWVALVRDKLATWATSTGERVQVAFGEFNVAANSLEQSTLLVGLVCGVEVAQRLREFAMFYRELTGKMLKGVALKEFEPSIAELSQRVQDITDAMRKEMGIEGTNEIQPKGV